MVKAAKITLSLPKPVLAWLQEAADQRYVTSNEYIRGLIVDLYVASQGAHARSYGTVSADSAPNTTAHNTPKLPGTRSGYKGVYPYGKRWAAVVSLDGKQERVAVCDTPEEAARVYDKVLMERAGGDPRAAVNAVVERGRTALVVDAPYIAKLQHGEPLTDVELAAWKRASASVPSAPSSTLPVTAGTPFNVDNNEPMTPPVRRQLRRGSAPAIDRPVDNDPHDDDGG